MTAARRTAHLPIGLALFALAWVLAFTLGCRQPKPVTAGDVVASAAPVAAAGTAPVTAAAPSLILPKATTSVAIEQRGDDPAWALSAATAPFVDDSGGP
ncbi:MAG: hypothetical protein HY902_13670, partial [Deltaproteobacteria bacterium]|nr:hypothetical protein [Deltaproteobacteria bacterium]